jgi:serine phosphatase RsbU (regulator of sigma subunit)
MRTLGYPGGRAAAEILTDTDATARGLGVDVLASAFLARFEQRPDGGALHWSNAGHPPPLLLAAAGGVRPLEAAPDPILGLPATRPRHEHVDELSPGDVVLLYTDGLIERVDEDIDRGLDALAERLAEARGRSLDELCDLILLEHQTGRRDDIALLALRVAP